MTAVVPGVSKICRMTLGPTLNRVISLTADRYTDKYIAFYQTICPVKNSESVGGVAVAAAAAAAAHHNTISHAMSGEHATAAPTTTDDVVDSSSNW